MRPTAASTSPRKFEAGRGATGATGRGAAGRGVTGAGRAGRRTGGSGATTTGGPGGAGAGAGAGRAGAGRANRGFTTPPSNPGVTTKGFRAIPQSARQPRSCKEPHQTHLAHTSHKTRHHLLKRAPPDAPDCIFTLKIGRLAQPLPRRDLSILPAPREPANLAAAIIPDRVHCFTRTAVPVRSLSWGKRPSHRTSGS